MRFADRREAGQRLAARVAELGLSDPVVLALPRGGVPVGYEVARGLSAPLDVLVVRKIGAPAQPELGVGAIAEGGEPLLDEGMLARLGRSRAELEPTISREREEVERRVRRYRGDLPALDVRGRTIVIVDDGLATGSTARAALRSPRAREAARIVLAVPVCAAETAERLRAEAHDIVCVAAPVDFRAVGAWYDRFEQTPDEVVVALLREARQAAAPAVAEYPVRLVAAGMRLDADLAIPERARGIVAFAHGSGSGRHSPRNWAVAAALHQAGFATLLLDLLTAEEEQIDARTSELRFDIDLLAGRLVGALDWLGEQPLTRSLQAGLFGASTGAGAALIAAAERPDVVAAVVSRGGRPDLAAGALERVRAPTLLIVGERDEVVIGLNRQAAELLTAEHALEIVPGAGHLFEEPGALDEVARLAAAWLLRFF